MTGESLIFMLIDWRPLYDDFFSNFSFFIKVRTIIDSSKTAHFVLKLCKDASQTIADMSFSDIAIFTLKGLRL